jgi:multidrug resistance efflux pump
MVLRSFLKRLLNPAALIFIVVGVLLVVVAWAVVYPAYQSPHSRLYASSIGYPVLLRKLNRPIPVVTRFVTMREMVRMVSGNGATEYLTTLPINSEVPGMIKRVHVEVGDHVNVGERLITLDTGGHVSRIAELDLDLKESEHKQSKENYEREKAFYDQGVTSRMQLEQVRLDMDEAVVALAKAKAAYQNSLRSRSKSVAEKRGETASTSLKPSAGVDIYSPITGTVIAQNVFHGENMVRPTDNLLLIADGLVFRAAMDQRYVSTIKRGDMAKVYLSAYPGQEFQGKVVRVDDRVSEIKTTISNVQSPFTFFVWVALSDVPPHASKIVQGMTGYCVFSYPMRTLAIPDSALIRFSGQHGLAMKVNASDRIELVPLTYLISAEGWLSVSSGLQENDRMITEGQTALLEHDLVSVQ